MVPLMFAGAGVLALVLAVYLFAGARARSRDLNVLASQLRPIDVGAFRNLINEREEEFLRQSLSWHEFRRIHGERMLAAIDYVRGAARNAGILIRLAEAAASDPDPTVATTAQNLLENATNVRLYAFQQIPRFYLSILLPGVRHAPHSLTERYDTMARQGTMLNCLTGPVGVASVDS
jgi:hypothetical protein